LLPVVDMDVRLPFNLIWVRLHCIDEKRKCSCTFRESGADSCIVRA
jgi:hypothetical protein